MKGGRGGERSLVRSVGSGWFGEVRLRVRIPRRYRCPSIFYFSTGKDTRPTRAFYAQLGQIRAQFQRLNTYNRQKNALFLRILREKPRFYAKKLKKDLTTDSKLWYN